MASGLLGWGDVVASLVSLRVAVQEARRREGLSLRAAASRTGVSFSTISRFENGEDIRLSSAVALMAWLAGPSVSGRSSGDGGSDV